MMMIMMMTIKLESLTPKTKTKIEDGPTEIWIINQQSSRLHFLDLYLDTKQ